VWIRNDGDQLPACGASTTDTAIALLYHCVQYFGWYVLAYPLFIIMGLLANVGS
jgi:hypothetical protein